MSKTKTLTMPDLSDRFPPNGNPPDGHVLSYSASDGYWVPSMPQNSVYAGGDLSGNYPDPTVVAIQGRNINSVSPSDGYALVWIHDDGYWAPRAVSAHSSNNVNNISYDITVPDGYDNIFIVGISQEITITLPDEPISGKKYVIKDRDGLANTYNITIDGNGNDIEQFIGGLSSNLLLDSDYDSVTLIYNGDFWSII